MTEYIKKEDVLRAYEEVQRRNGPWRFETLIESVPTADVAPLQHGRWIYDHWCEFKCSVCGEFSNSKPYRGKENYCPNCGAIMDGKCKESAGEE